MDLTFPFERLRWTSSFNHYRVAKTTTQSFVHLDCDEHTWSEITVKEFEAIAKAHYALWQALNDDGIFRVINFTSAFDTWQNLITINEGITQVKKAKIDLLNSQYDSSHMLDCEPIDDMIIWFITITNGLVSIGKPISNDQKVWDIIRAVPESWEVKTITLKELNEKKEMDFIWFMGNLKIQERELKAREEHELPKNTNVSFKASQSRFKKKEDSDEELSMLAAVGKFLRN